MSAADQARSELARAIGVLIARRNTTTDDKERRTISRTINRLNAKIRRLDQAALLDAAQAVADATTDLEKVVAAARIGPFDSYLADLQEVINGLYQAEGEIHKQEALPPAEEAEEKVAEVLAEPPPVEPLPAGTPLQPPIRSRRFAELANEYAAYYAACQIRPEHQDKLAYYLTNLERKQALYQQVGDGLGGIPWYFIGIIHAMECGFNFAGHLHNGDPLTARTAHVPKGRPPVGTPPFTWKQSARDALMLHNFHQVSDWSVPHVLFLLEKYNGFGYRLRGLPSPYLWSFSNLYEKGKYVADGEFDPNAVSKQCGAAVILKALGIA